jgi:hypothetical protein
MDSGQLAQSQISGKRSETGGAMALEPKSAHSGGRLDALPVRLIGPHPAAGRAHRAWLATRLCGARRRRRLAGPSRHCDGHERGGDYGGHGHRAHGECCTTRFVAKLATVKSAGHQGPWLTPMRRFALEVAARTLFGLLWPRRMAAERRRQASLRGVAGTTVVNTAVWYLIEGRRAMSLAGHGPGGPEIVERVRRSVERTRAEGTAALGYVPWVAGSISWHSQERLGRVDFRAERSLYAHADDEWMLLAPAQRLEGRPGAWYASSNDSHLLTEDDPFWLLAVIAATVEATDEGPQSVGGSRCERYLASADLALAASNSARPVAPIQAAGDERMDRIPVEVWLDSEGRIRRARLHRGRAVIRMQFLNFGAVPAIELPDPSELLSEDEE